ncbi:MAG: glycosyltransferase family 4 protein, partial [Bacteroidota bacterium]|nr:glycosyltransferase family 4 protein [Bacteroidota bacterium]
SAVKLVMIDFDADLLKAHLEEIGDPGLLNEIVMTGYINNQDLPTIYSQAMVFLYPSLRESFGIPILEAMACGRPVITSNTSSMPEVAGKAALLVDPFSPQEIADAMLRYYQNPSLREAMSLEGLHRAAKFSWDGAAESVLSIYENTAAATRQEQITYQSFSSIL